MERSWFKSPVKQKTKAGLQFCLDRSLGSHAAATASGWVQCFRCAVRFHSWHFLVLSLLQCPPTQHEPVCLSTPHTAKRAEFNSASVDRSVFRNMNPDYQECKRRSGPTERLHQGALKPLIRNHEGKQPIRFLSGSRDNKTSHNRQTWRQFKSVLLPDIHRMHNTFKN